MCDLEWDALCLKSSVIVLEGKVKELEAELMQLGQDHDNGSINSTTNEQTSLTGELSTLKKKLEIERQRNDALERLLVVIKTSLKIDDE